MEYCKRGKSNPFDAYMAGICMWMTPRQILIIDKMCELFKDVVDVGIEEEAFLDFKSQIEHEAAIKKKKYLEDI